MRPVRGVRARIYEASTVSKKNPEKLLEKLQFDEDLRSYRCQCLLAGKAIGVFIGCEPDALGSMADVAEALLREWPTLRQTILEAAQDELVACKRLDPRDKQKVTPASLVPFSLSVDRDLDGEAYFSFGLNIVGILEEPEYFDYGNNLEKTDPIVEICCTE
jgi:hypothetical protein